MKNLYFIILLFVSSVSFSQEIHLGKTTAEIASSTSYKTYNMVLNGKQSICAIVDTNITDIYIFNMQGICIEYNRLISNIGFDTIEAYLSDYYNQGSVWVNNSKGLVAMVSQMSNRLYKISIRKMY